MSPSCNCLSLRRATRKVTQLYDQALAPIGLRATQYSLLQQIERLGPLTLKPLAESMVMDRATIGHNIRPLQALGLVRLSVGKDRRSREVSATTAGRKLLARGKPFWTQAQAVFEAQMGRDGAASLRSVLGRVAATEFALI
jgi:DNA-binding MarR family transcriptional regulator